MLLSLINRFSPLAHSTNTVISPEVQHALDELKQWEFAVPGENRSIAASRIREVYEKQLTVLDLSGLSTLTSLPNTLPSTLKTLNLNGCKMLQALPGNLPNTLETLSLGGCEMLQALPNTLPNTLQRLVLTDCKSLIALPQLPDSIRFLYLGHCESLTALPNDVPPALQHLYLSHCPALKTLPDSLAQTSLQNLYIENCSLLETLPDGLPITLERVYLTNCLALKTLPDKLPPMLQRLEVKGCMLLEKLPSLPDGLKYLYLRHCPSLHTLPPLPTMLNTLHLEECKSVKTLPDQLPTMLKRLCLINCTSLDALPLLPTALTSIHIVNCTSLKDLPHLSKALEYKHVDKLTSKSLPTVPPHEQWYKLAGKTTTQIKELKTKWSTLSQEVDVNKFDRLLRTLGENHLKNSIRPEHVAAVMDEMVTSPATCKLIIQTITHEKERVHEHPLSVFSTIQALAQSSKLQRQEGNNATEAILELAKGMVKQTLLDDCVQMVMTRQWKEKKDEGKPRTDANRRRPSNEGKTGPWTGDKLAVQLSLRHDLAQALDLPFSVNATPYMATAILDEKDKTFALNHVKNKMKEKDSVIKHLLLQPVWTHYLMTRFAEEVHQIKQAHKQTIEDFEAAYRKGFVQPADYAEQSKLLLTERNHEIQQLFRQKTREIMH